MNVRVVRGDLVGEAIKRYVAPTVLGEVVRVIDGWENDYDFDAKGPVMMVFIPPLQENGRSIQTALQIGRNEYLENLPLERLPNPGTDWCVIT